MARILKLSLLVALALLLVACTAMRLAGLPSATPTTLFSSAAKISGNQITKIVIHNYWKVTPVAWKERSYQDCYPFVDSSGNGGGTIFNTSGNDHVTLYPNPKCNGAGFDVDTYSLPGSADICTLSVPLDRLGESIEYGGRYHTSYCRTKIDHDGTLHYTYNMLKKYRP